MTDYSNMSMDDLKFLERRLQEEIAKEQLSQNQDLSAMQQAGLGIQASLQGVGRNIGIPFTDVDVSHGLESLGAVRPYEDVRADVINKGGWIAPTTEIATDIGLTAIPATAAVRYGKNLGPLAKSLSATGVGGLAARGAVEGAVSAAMTGQNKNPLLDMASGAFFGSIGSPVMSLAGRPLSGMTKASDDAARLIKEGIPVTPGQGAEQAGLGHLISGIEEALTSAPLTGPMLKGIRGRGLEKLRAKAIEQGLPPGMKLPKTASLQPLRALREIGEEFSRRYNSILSSGSKNALTVPGGLQEIPSKVKVPEGFSGGVLKVAFSDPDSYITPNRLKHTAQRILNAIDFESMSPKQVFAAQSDLRKSANKIYSTTSATIEDHSVADAYRRAADFILDGLEKGLPNGEQLQALRGPYKNYVNLLHETEKFKGFGSTLSPRALRKGAEKARNKNMADLARTAEEVLPSSTPDSGTAGRLATMTALGAAGGYLQGGDVSSSLKGAAIGAGMMAPGLLMTTPVGSKFVFGQYPWQKATGALMSGVGGIGGGILGADR